MKRTKRNNKRLKGGSGSNNKSSTRKTQKKEVKFTDEDTCKIDILPEYTYAINVKPDQTKSGPSILKIKKSKAPDGVLPRPGDIIFTASNQSKKYKLGLYDKTSRCKKTGKKACEIENNIRESKSKSKGGKKSSYKSRKSGKKTKKRISKR
jgi:hypothetical protein